ncbi:hypothetical protein [Haloparvum sp. PAK95]|uniref:hypothetical protein n=1 Tax=Haloparvum sp. PAK95 TaxID=3418962 RepID=UPI003D2F168C
MAEWTPPTMQPTTKIGIGALVLLLTAYAILIAGQLLLVVQVIAMGATVYVAWRALLAVEAIAEAQQRIAAAEERNEEGHLTD